MQSRDILNRVNNYINHAHQVYKNSHYTNRLEFERIMANIAWCKNTAKGINEFSGILNVCRSILVMRNHLREILPHPLNDSYETSLAEYNGIIAFCEDILKDKLAIH